MGGSFLGSSRGGHDTKAIVDSLEKEGINLLFVTGGDGTVRGAALIADEVRNRGLEIAVAVIPKTIDNDIPLIDRTFGFESAVNAARQAIDVAVTEAEGFPYGLGCHGRREMIHRADSRAKACFLFFALLFFSFGAQAWCSRILVQRNEPQ
ncbi:unnamed protein product [Cylindrotheca closterium]|uniref:Phosphofructokinase domain-containing protein n=1 Tax=Cylindrotheca closterium TaxID=2856 RepID=A0AAD2FER7_9STRA|nr:unnamed protein product [Cylindrotheca closterium]